MKVTYMSDLNDHFIIYMKHALGGKFIAIKSLTMKVSSVAYSENKMLPIIKLLTII